MDWKEEEVTGAKLDTGKRTPDDNDIFTELNDPVAKALSNYLILKNIFSHLKPRELLACRQLNRLWEEEATRHIQILSSKYKNSPDFLFQVSFFWDEPTRQFYRYRCHQKLNSRTNLSLSQFYEVWTNSRAFRWSSFDFHCTQDLATITQEAEDPNNTFCSFFISFGKEVKSLTLNLYSYSNPSTFSVLRKIVFQWTPNLTSLTLHLTSLIQPTEMQKVDQDNEEEKDFYPESEYSLPNLQILKLSGGKTSAIDLSSKQKISRFILDILNSAPNLQEVHDLDLYFTDELISASRIQLVNFFTWRFFKHSDLRRFLLFVQESPQLTTCNFTGLQKFTLFSSRLSLETRSAVVTNLNYLLQSSAQTLRSIKDLDELSFLPGVQLVRMSRVDQVTVKRLDALSSWQMLPLGFDLGQVFPNLKCLRVNWQCGDAFSKNSLFSPCNSSGSVQELCLDVGREITMTGQWIEKISILWPTVSVLRIRIEVNLNFLPNICTAVWQFLPGLREFHLTLSGMTGAGQSSGFYTGVDLTEKMDAAITGLSVKLMEKMQRENCHEIIIKAGEFSEKVLEAGENIKILKLGENEKMTRMGGNPKFLESRENPSIFDLKNLQSFNIEFRNSKPLFTDLCNLLVFEYMRRRQDLKVFVNDREFTSDCTWI